MNHEEWSAAQQRATVSVDSHELEVAYRHEGPEDAQPLVFLHGIPTWGFLWRQIAPHFEDDYQVIVPDMVGYGNSASHDGFDRSIRAQEQMLEDLLSQLGVDSFYLVAHDIGGGAALRYAAHNPDRVEKFVLSNAVCYDSWPVEFVSNLGLPETTTMDDAEFEGQLDFAFGEGTYGEPDPEFVEGMKSPWLREGGKVAISRAAVATNTNHTMELDYENIDADMLYLWAEDDVMQPIEYAEKLSEHVGGDVVPLSEAFHWVVEDRPEAYREHLREFLEEER